MEQRSNSIAEQTGFEQLRVLIELTKIRFVMVNDPPEIFSGIVEGNEIYFGGQTKNKQKTNKKTSIPLTGELRIAPVLLGPQVGGRAVSREP